MSTKQDSIFEKYSNLPKLAGKYFIPIGFLARLPMAMLTIGALTFVTATTGSYVAGGSVAGSIGLGSALGAILVGFLADKYGQRPILLSLTFIHSFLIFATATLAAFSNLLPATLIVSFFMGATIPQVGSLARARWIAMPDQNKHNLDTAFSYESTADEITFVVGPALVGILAATLNPWIPLVVAGIMTLFLVFCFAVHPTERLVRKIENKHADKPRFSLKKIFSKQILILIVAMLLVGTVFGGLQNSLNAFGGSYGHAEHAGLLYAIMGIGSAISAILVPYWSEKISLETRWIWCAMLLTIISLGLLPSSQIGVILLVLFVTGICVGPILVTIFALAATAAAQNTQTTVMTSLASGLVAGVSLGAVSAGFLVQNLDYQFGFLAPIAGAACLFLLALVYKYFFSHKTQQNILLTLESK